MRSGLLILAFLLLSCFTEAQVLPSFGNSRTGTAGMQFLKLNPDAASNSMAGAVVATTSGAASMFWNPAGISRVSEERLHLEANNTLYFSGFNIASLSAVYRPGQETFWGVYVYSMNSPLMEETTEFQPKGTGRTFSVNNVLAGFTYSRILTNNFSFGVNAKYARESYIDVAVNNVLFDLGLHYDVGIRNARFGVTLSNFGINVQPTGTVTILKFNGEETLDDFETVSVPAIFRIGAAFDPIDRENHRLTVSAQLNHPTDNNETLSFGLEYLIRKTFVVRSGYEFGQDISGFPPLGLGVLLPRRFGKLQIDYGFSNHRRLGNIHRFGIGIAFK